jgi:serine/threonine protein kinase
MITTCLQIGSYTDPKYFAFIMLPVADWNMTTYMASAASSANKRSLLRSFFGCLANGLQYLHGSKIRHRDIKPENILIKDDRVLLSDFGIALDWEHLSRSTTTAGSAKSPIYCAPEVAQYRKRNASSDIWSLGCVFLEMVTVLKGESISDMRMLFKGRNGHYRFYGNTEATMEWIGKLRHIGSGEDDEPLNWVTKMLEWNPESRPTASALFADITRPPANVLTIFCGPCCGPDEDSSESVDSDGELWIDDDESLDAEVICDTSGLGYMSTPQSNSTDRSTPSHSPAPCQKEAPDKADLGESIDDVGKKAEAMYKRALEGREKTLGPDHKSTLDTAYNLGKLYMDQGKPAEAEALYQRALTGYEEVLGPDHCYTLDAIYYLGKVSLDQGKLPEAEALYQRALTGREKALGPEHRSTLDTVYNTGIMYSDLGRLTEAEPLYQRAIAGYEAVLGPEHVCTLNVVGNLGRLYALQRRREEEKKM